MTVGSVAIQGTRSEGGTSTRHYRSPARALAWFFKKSRDGWKKKYMALKAELKRTKVRVRDVVRSREKWRARAEQAEAKLAEMQAEVERLQALVGSPPEAEKGGRRGHGPPRPQKSRPSLRLVGTNHAP